MEGHPSAKSHVAREMLRRLKEDVGHFASEVRTEPRYAPVADDATVFPLLPRVCVIQFGRCCFWVSLLRRIVSQTIDVFAARAKSKYVR